MSRIDELIQQLCPDGVEYKPLGDLCGLARGKVISKDYLRAHAGTYPVYSSQTADDGVFGRINSFEYDGVYLTWTTDGANAGSVFFRSGRFSITNVCGLLELRSSDILLKFLFYWLRVVAPSYVNAGMGNPKLMSNVMATISCPIPPLPVQEEIVRILDKFTLLEAELEAELEARRKQYEYYRDQLLTFGDEVEWKPLGEICKDILAGGDLPLKYQKGQTVPSKEFPYPIYSNGSGNNALYGFSDSYRIKEKAVTISARGTIGYHAVREANFTPIVRLVVLIPIPQLISVDYLNYILDMTDIGHSGGSIPQLTVPCVKKIRIPVPPLAEQERIVAILDKFDALVNDISSGLPAELEMRRKQYEYYRDKLLTFKPIAKEA